MRKLSTHVLDTTIGEPARGVRIELRRELDSESWRIYEGVTNSDGRTDHPLLAGEDLEPGKYQLFFHLGAYFHAVGHRDARRFLDVVPVFFTITDATRSYHVPLLASPWAYSTYRGS